MDLTDPVPTWCPTVRPYIRRVSPAGIQCCRRWCISPVGHCWQSCMPLAWCACTDWLPGAGHVSGGGKSNLPGCSLAKRCARGLGCRGGMGCSLLACGAVAPGPWRHRAGKNRFRTLSSSGHPMATTNALESRGYPAGSVKSWMCRPPFTLSCMGSLRVFLRQGLCGGMQTTWW